MVLGECRRLAHYTNGQQRKVRRLAPNKRFMQQPSDIRKIAFLGDYLPRKCGIATFTTDLRCAVAAKFPAMQCLVVPVNDLAEQVKGLVNEVYVIGDADKPGKILAAVEKGAEIALNL